METIRKTVREVVALYAKRMIPRASAALSYYLTMTLFPMILCLYAMFGQNYQLTMRIFDYIKQFLTPSAAELIRDYLLHVTGSSSQAVLVAAITMLVLSASAAVRVLEGTLNEMQGGQRFRAVTNYFISFALAAGLLLTVYLSLALLLTGHQIVLWVERTFSVKLAIGSWDRLRQLLMGGVALLLLWGMFGFTRPRDDRYLVLPGAALATVGIVVTSNVFSVLIASSARYSLVYGSLASMILLMFWLYLICQTIFVGAALNIALRNVRARGNGDRQ